jgi:hypothetical protein
MAFSGEIIDRALPIGNQLDRVGDVGLFKGAVHHEHIIFIVFNQQNRPVEHFHFEKLKNILFASKAAGPSNQPWWIGAAFCFVQAAGTSGR